MPGAPIRWPAPLALAGSLVGFAFAASSTLDYTNHLDRQVHAIRCSYIPGLSAAQGADAACRAALYSPFAALWRDRYWGGIPISLFAVGAFAFFAAFSLYVLLAGAHAPRKSLQFLGIAGITPAIASAAMLFISATRLGSFCKTCVGIYVGSTMLAVAGVTAFLHDRREAHALLARAPRPAGGAPPTVIDRGAPRPVRREGGFLLVPTWLVALAVFTVVPALLYRSALPNYAPYVTGCGKLEQPTESSGALLRIAPAGASVPATLFVDPLCPTCKAFHQRLVAEGYFDQLDTTVVLFPLDSECNWMLAEPVHPGACAVAKAVLCADARAREVLEWAYEEQERLLAAAKAGAGVVNVRAMLRERFPDLDACIDAKETDRRMQRMLRFIVNNQLPVSTPQMFLGETRLCDEDSDIGLAYTMKQLAPSLRTR